MTDPALDPSVEEVLERLVPRHRDALGTNLRALYLFGSAVTGSFEPDISDVDLVAVLVDDPDAVDLRSLEALHRRLVEETPEWDDRIEVVYLSEGSLAEFRAGPRPAARISPGEPFHSIEVDETWILDWGPLRHHGIALFGPPATELVPAIGADEYVAAVRRHLVSSPTDADALATRGAQAYAILTICRGLRTIRTGDYVSKREAAAWASVEMPQHVALIEAAVSWRESSRSDAQDDAATTLDATVGFIRDVARRL